MENTTRKLPFQILSSVIIFRVLVIRALANSYVLRLHAYKRTGDSKSMQGHRALAKSYVLRLHAYKRRGDPKSMQGHRALANSYVLRLHAYKRRGDTKSMQGHQKCMPRQSGSE